jgi:hypothetical protein
MRGSVVKRTDSKGRTCYFVIIEERDAAGKRRRRWRSDPSTGSGFTSRRAADMYAATLVTSINDGTYVEPNRDTLGAWLDVWLAIIQPTVRPSTWASYEKNVRLHIKPYLGWSICAGSTRPTWTGCTSGFSTVAASTIGPESGSRPGRCATSRRSSGRR